MKIKHWQGYGTITAKKVSQKSVKVDEWTFHGEHITKGTQVIIHLQGNHEYGLERDDEYDVYNWLLKKFCKAIPEYNDLKFIKVNIESYYKRNEKENIDEENADYTITYA